MRLVNPKLETVSYYRPRGGVVLLTGARHFCPPEKELGTPDCRIKGEESPGYFHGRVSHNNNTLGVRPKSNAMSLDRGMLFRLGHFTTAHNMLICVVASVVSLHFLFR